MNKDEARSAVMGAISMALKDPTLQQGFEVICKNLVELEKENKTVSRKANETIADKLLITAKYNEVLNDLNQENGKLQNENAELKEELQKWKDEWQEQVQKATDEGYARTLQTIQLNNAKEIIRDLINLTEPTSTEEVQHWNETFRKAEQFIKDSEGK